MVLRHSSTRDLIISILECALLSSGSQGGVPHPDCAIQLRHAASELRSRAVLNIDYQIAPLQN